MLVSLFDELTVCICSKQALLEWRLANAETFFVSRNALNATRIFWHLFGEFYSSVRSMSASVDLIAMKLRCVVCKYLERRKCALKSKLSLLRFLTGPTRTVCWPCSMRL
jgi:hypothetical protein